MQTINQERSVCKMAKKHEFIALKMGAIEQYSMVAHVHELAHWKQLGWLEHQEVGLPKGDEKAYMLYGKINKNERLLFNRPLKLSDIQKERILGLEVKGISTHLGTYGMGGAGFFGILLNNGEFLTYAIWGAGNYVIINDRVVECNLEFYTKTRPWLSSFGEDKTWDELSDVIVGSKLEAITLTSNRCHFVFKKEESLIDVCFVKNDSKLPRKRGRKRNGFAKGILADYIVFQHENARLIV